MDRGVSGLQSKGSQKVGQMSSHAAVASFFQYLLFCVLPLPLPPIPVQDPCGIHPAAHNFI